VIPRDASVFSHDASRKLDASRMIDRPGIRVARSPAADFSGSLAPSLPPPLSPFPLFRSGFPPFSRYFSLVLCFRSAHPRSLPICLALYLVTRRIHCRSGEAKHARLFVGFKNPSH